MKRISKLKLLIKEKEKELDQKYIKDINNMKDYYLSYIYYKTLSKYCLFEIYNALLMSSTTEEEFEKKLQDLMFEISQFRYTDKDYFRENYNSIIKELKYDVKKEELFASSMIYEKMEDYNYESNRNRDKELDKIKKSFIRRRNQNGKQNK